MIILFEETGGKIGRREVTPAVVAGRVDGGGEGFFLTVAETLRLAEQRLEAFWFLTVRRVVWTRPNTLEIVLAPPDPNNPPVISPWTAVGMLEEVRTPGSQLWWRVLAPRKFGVVDSDGPAKGNFFFELEVAWENGDGEVRCFWHCSEEEYEGPLVLVFFSGPEARVRGAEE